MAHPWPHPRATLNQKLALTAFALGVVALFANPYRGNVVRLDARELAAVIGREDDHVTADELAAWIVEGRSDYRLIDLRTESDFAAYHVPTAESIPLPVLPDASVARDEKVVLYSDGGVHASQAWMLLRAKGYRGVYTLKGGLEAWKDEVLFPSLARGTTQPEQVRYDRVAARSRFFGGAPRVTGSTEARAQALPMPKVEAPAAGPGPTAAPKKKREGC
jgi:uncharacterized protein